jgi:hypothetical protein
MYDIKDRNLEQIYIDNFDKLYKTNANYSKLRIVINEEELKYIEELKINDRKVKTISLLNFQEGESEGCVPKYITFLKRFKSLKCLTLYDMKFTPAIELNFPGLEKLHFNNCENITLNQELCLNIKKLRFNNSFFQKTKKLLQFPKLVELNVYELEIIENIKLVFDFSSLKNLKTLYSHYELFLLLYNLPLEKLIIFDAKKEQQKELLQKIIDKKSLLSISLGLELDAEEILSLKGQNCTVQEADIGCSYATKVDAFQKKFPNVFSLNASLFLGGSEDRNKKIVELEENKSLKLKKISIDACGNNDVKLLCGAYEQLEWFSFEHSSYSCYFEFDIPMLIYESDVVFKNLSHFNFSIDGKYDGLDFDILLNIYTNLDKMPNLKYFCFNHFIHGEVDKEIYKLMITKLLSKNLSTLILKIYPKDCVIYYSADELKEIYPEVYVEEYDIIEISKHEEDENDEESKKSQKSQNSD